VKIIRDRAIVDDEFTHIADGQPLDPTAPPFGGASRSAHEALVERPIVSLARVGEALASHAVVGVRVPTDTLPAAIPALARLALVAIELPKLTDGRAFSLGRMLRERHGFRGELRATGYVTRDQLLQLERCGFNAFEVRAGKPLDSALEAFAELPAVYQATVADPRPIYRRR